MTFFIGGIIMKSKYAYPNILRRIYIRLHMKYCKLFHKKYIREYTAVFKYKNKIDYFIRRVYWNGLLWIDQF